MQKLPKGYYAVLADYENAAHDTFEFKGVTYEVQEGVNLFAKPHDAERAACDIPDTVLDGLCYECFDAPVLLFSPGKHNIDRCTLGGARYWLGARACVNPNVWGEDPLCRPARSPARDEQGETELCGTYDYGYIIINSLTAHLTVLDGFTLANARSHDTRTEGELNCRVIFRNNIYKSPCGKLIHNFNTQTRDGGLHREFVVEDSRLVDFDDLGYGGILLIAENEKTVFRRFCFDNTALLFGLNDMTRGCYNHVLNKKLSEIELTDCYFGHMRGENGIATGCPDCGDHGARMTVTGCTFLDASRKGEAVLQPHMPNDTCSLIVRDCRFVDTRGNAAAVMVLGGRGSVTVERTVLRGFDTDWVPAPTPPARLPKKIRNKKRDWTTDTADPHRVIGTSNADFTALSVRYENKKAYYCDQHVHTACGGTSDGTYPMSKWVARMNELGLDLAIVVDHMQMRGFFLPEWDTDRFVYGTEPGGSITDLQSCRYPSYRSFHYNMLFKDKYDLALLLANFPEYKFKGDELTGRFKYPSFTKERFAELVSFIHKIGGMIVHPHPRTLLCSDDPMEYAFGEWTYLETLYESPASAASFRNYELWCEILDRGGHVLTSGGSDTHGSPNVRVVSTFYLPERTGRACFDCMKTGDYTVGGFGIKMCIDGKPMGSRLAYRKGMKLTLRVDDCFAPNRRENTAYELRVFSDRGLAYASTFDGTQSQELALLVKERRFYRAEIFDLTHGYRVAVGNPIWLDA